MADWRLIFRLKLKELLAIRESPHEVAKAFALGVFVGIMPAMGTAVALVIAFLLRLNKTATVLGSLIVNPWTAPFFYVGCFKVGTWFFKLPDPIQWKRIITFDLGWHAELFRVAPPLLIGSFVVGLISASVSYGIIWWVLSRYQRLRHRRGLAQLES